MTKQKLELYYFDSCPYCQKVLRVINELKIKVEYRDILQNKEYKQKLINDTGRKTVPCLYIDNIPMHESDDIIYWLKKNQNSIDKNE